jgi:Putative Flp pilus-assembly TadE/G-like
MRVRGGNRGRSQRGQTMALVAISIVSLLAMAALAIDVVTLYAARGQAERAADAASLAAAKALADSGVTTDPTNASPDNIWKAACALATQEAIAVAAQNPIVGQSPTPVLTFNAPAPDCSTPNVPATSTFSTNPQVTVSLTATGLPTFFARIWSGATNSASGTAIAEAYNPSGSASSPNGELPNAPRCVKPLLLPNCDPNINSGCTGSGNTFVALSDGTITNPGDQSNAGVIGETIELQPQCTSSGCLPSATKATKTLSYYAVRVPLTAGYMCPGNCSMGALPSGDPFQDALACCNLLTLQCGGSGALTLVPNAIGTIQSEAAAAGQCLIHGTGSLTGNNCQSSLEQDCLDTASPPLFTMKAGSNNPLVSKASGSGVAVSDIITTSDSVVSLPIYDPTTNQMPTNPIQIIGYLQVFINDVDSSGDVFVTVLNVAGCGNSSPGGSEVVGAGPAVPVRLIH